MGQDAGDAGEAGDATLESGQVDGADDGGSDVLGDAADAALCDGGATCTPSNPCHTGTIDCSSGTPVCKDTGNSVPNGTSCGTEMVCNNGSCGACTQGAPCTPANNPCATGTTDCSSGVPVCNATGTAADTASCGSTDQWCCSGACLTCTLPSGAAPACSSGSCNWTCKPGYQMCNGGCADYANDPNNCGSCGHSCLGGSCSGGLCQPVTIATASGIPLGITFNSAVYWADDESSGAILTCLSNNCGASPTTLVSGQNYPGAITMASGVPVWTTANAVMRCTNNGCGLGSPVTIASGQSSTGTVAADATNVYWLAGSSVLKCAISGCSSPTTLASNQSLGSTNNGITVDSTDVYWTTTSNVMKTPIAGGSAVTLASGRASPAGIAVDSNNVYWTETSGQDVLECPLAGCGGTPMTLASSQNTPFGIVVDSVNVYWSNRGAGIMRCAIGGCGGAPTALTTGTNSWNLAQSGTALYFFQAGAPGTYSVQMLAK